MRRPNSRIGNKRKNILEMRTELEETIASAAQKMSKEKQRMKGRYILKIKVKRRSLKGSDKCEK